MSVTTLASQPASTLAVQSEKGMEDSSSYMVDTLTSGPPPPYTEQAEDALMKDHHITEVESKISTTIYTVNSRLQGTSNSFETLGRLEVGRVQHLGVNRYRVWIKPVKGQEDDISHEVRSLQDLEPSDTRTHLFKRSNRLVRPYGFDIYITDHMTDDGTFIGTFTSFDYKTDKTTTYDIKGEALVVVMEKAVAIKKFTYPEPAQGVKGTQLLIRQISPYAWKTDPKPEEKTEGKLEEQGVKYRTDEAQYNGDKLMQKIMFHALDENSRKKLLPSVPDLPQDEKAIMESNRDLFKRMAVHFLADQLKNMNEIDEDVRNKITIKFQDFLKMLAAKDKPVGTVVINGKEEPVKDPVEVYGFHRGSNSDEELMTKLRAQYTDATMRCYELGYVQKCPEWKDYMETPLYWFKYLEAYLTSSEFLDSWQSKAQDTSEFPGAMTTAQELQFWANKLSLLKHAASEHDSKEMNIKAITDRLQTLSIEAAAAAKLIDAEFVKSTQESYKKITEAKETKENMERFKSVTHQAKQIHDGILAETAETLSHLADPQHGLAQQINKYWQNRLPRIVIIPPPNVQQIGEALNEAAIMGGEGEAQNFFQRLRGKFAGFFENVNWRKVVCGTIQGIIKGAALYYMVYSCFVGFTDKQVAVGRMGLLITMAVAEGLKVLKWGTLKLLTWAYARIAQANLLGQQALGWMSRAFRKLGSAFAWVAEKFVKHFDKIIKFVGVVACVWSIYNSYWDMTHAEEIDEQYRTAYLVFNSIQFALGCIEGFLLVVDLLATIFSWGGRVASMAGPLAMYVGLLTLAVAIVYYIWFRPDPLADVKNFLKEEAKPVGSYLGD